MTVGPHRPTVDELPREPVTRFAPAPTGHLHLGHVVNAIWTWGLARAAGGEVVLRVEDHDRQRSRAVFERELLDDLEWLGFVPDRPAFAELRSDAPSSYRQSDSAAAYEAALEALGRAAQVYRCACSRTTFARYEADNGRPWAGPGCPRGCATREIGRTEETVLRAALGDGDEAWNDVLAGSLTGPVAMAGDLVVRDRLGNWTYGFAVVVDDLRHGVDLVVRGSDLVADTPRQIRLARVLGRARPARFAHHPLVYRADGSKLSKSAGDSGVRDLRAAGWSPVDVIAAAASAVGLDVAGLTDASLVSALVVEGASDATERTAATPARRA
jgi:glutamyl/glutaminyl-tRNA synthetase